MLRKWTSRAGSAMQTAGLRKKQPREETGIMRENGVQNAGFWRENGDQELGRRELERKELRVYMNIVERREQPFDIDTYQHIVKLCTKLKSRTYGAKVHDHIRKNRMDSERFIGNDLVFMYASFGDCTEAKRIFDNLGSQNIFSFTGIMRAYVNTGNAEEALKLFHLARLKTISPDESMYSMALEAAGMKVDIELGRCLHDTVTRNGLDRIPSIAEALIGMYSCCGDLHTASDVFEKMRPLRRVRVWNAYIAANARTGHFDGALHMFRTMDFEALPMSSGTLLPVIEHCTDLPTGKMLESCVWDLGLQQVYQLGVALVEMYGTRCTGFGLGEAVRVYETMKKRDSRLWGVIIRGYVMHGKRDEAMRGFERMYETGIVPSKDTYLKLLEAGPDLRECKRIHASIVWNKVGIDGDLREKLRDAYAATKPGRDGLKSMIRVHERVVKWAQKKAAAVNYVHSFFDFQD